MKSKFLFLTAFLVLSLPNLQAKTLIVSDLDDTIKVSDVLGSKAKNFYNALVKKTAFAGMSELYQELSNNETTIYYVSGSPKLIRSRVDNFLKDNKFPQRENLILKSKMSDDTFEYKTAAIRELIKKINPDKIIMIGDDGEYDPQVYNGIAQENPGVESAIYIRAISNRAGVEKSFVAAVEIAGFEYLEGRLAGKSLVNVTRGFVTQSNHSAISIKDRYCPAEGSAGLEELIAKAPDQVTLGLFNMAQDKVKASCK